MMFWVRFMFHVEMLKNNFDYFISAAASAPPYPYQQFQAQPAYDPGSQFQAPPGTAPPPYTAGTQPAYMPTLINQPGSNGNGNMSAHATNMNGSDPVYPPPTQQHMYNGYGTGPNGAQT